MKVLFDHNVPKRLRTLLPGHELLTSGQLGWDRLKNSDLLEAAEKNGFQVVLTGDKNMSYQQNLGDRKVALIVLADTDWPTLKQNPAPALAALEAAQPGSLTRLTEPAMPRRIPRKQQPPRPQCCLKFP